MSPPRQDILKVWAAASLAWLVGLFCYALYFIHFLKITYTLNDVLIAIARTSTLAIAPPAAFALVLYGLSRRLKNHARSVTKWIFLLFFVMAGAYFTGLSKGELLYFWPVSVYFFAAGIILFIWLRKKNEKSSDDVGHDT